MRSAAGLIIAVGVAIGVLSGCHGAAMSVAGKRSAVSKRDFPTNSQRALERRVAAVDGKKGGDGSHGGGEMS